MCVIGAGKSGLIASKVLKERGIPFDCFEAGSQVNTPAISIILDGGHHILASHDAPYIAVQVGGLWVLNSDSGRAGAYESLRINTSKQMTSFHDFPMPKHYPTFASREQVQRPCSMCPCMHHASAQVFMATASYTLTQC